MTKCRVTGKLPKGGEPNSSGGNRTAAKKKGEVERTASQDGKFSRLDIRTSTLMKSKKVRKDTSTDVW